MDTYTIKYMRPLGDFDTKFGQKYWGKVNEADMDVSFNIMNPVNFEEHDEIEYEERLIKKTKTGKEYLQLKKVKKSSGSGEGATQSHSKESSTIKESNSSAADSKYLKDISDYPLRVYTAGLPYIDMNHMMKSDKEMDTYLDFVDRVAGRLLTMTEKIRSGTFVAETASKELTGKDKFADSVNKLKGEDVTEEYGEQDIPDFER